MDDNPLDKIEILTQPLLTEQGFLNEACMNELAAAIANMPEAYDRLANEPEWSLKRITSFREVMGALAKWAVRQLDHDVPAFPPSLEKVLGFVAAVIKPRFTYIDQGWAEISLCDINRMLHEILDEEPLFKAWNTEECLGKSWLDLSALLHNVCIDIRDERRLNDEFDRSFTEEHGCNVEELT